MKRAISLLALAAALGCGVEFPPQSTLASLRVLGVRKDKPYAKPGDTVKLSVLYDDAVPPDSDAGPQKREINILWAAKCENPVGDVYYGCFEQLAKAFAQSQSGGLGALEGFDYGSNHVEFSFKLSPDIIKKHARPTDNSTNYGLAFVFFILCAGDVGPAPAGQQFPVACFSKSGDQLGANDFLVGYTAVYAYDSITNANPLVTGFSVDGVKIKPQFECIDDACVAEELGGRGSSLADAGILDAGETGSDASVRDAGSREAAAPAPAPVPVDPCANADSITCFDVCTAAEQKDCPEHDIQLETDPNTIEIDKTSQTRESGPIKEQAWINYYVDRGELVNDVKLLNDATNGYNEDHGTKIRVPKKVGPFQVWGVAHDNRGGVGWVKVRLGTRPAK